MAHALTQLVEHMGAMENIPEGVRTRDWYEIYAYNLSQLRRWLDGQDEFVKRALAILPEHRWPASPAERGQ